MSRLIETEKTRELHGVSESIHTMVPRPKKNRSLNAKLLGSLAVVGAIGAAGFMVVRGQNHLPLVSVAEVTSGAAASGVVAEGSITPSSVVYVTPLPTMRDPIAHVYVNAGTYVKKGQVLADIDPITQKVAYDKAQSNLLAQEAGLALARSPYRVEQLKQALFKVNGDRQLVAEAKAALDLLKNGSDPMEIAAAGAEVDTARAKLNQAQKQRDAFAQQSPDEAPEVIAAKGDVANAQAQASQAEKKYNSYKQLFTEGAVSRLQYDQAETDLTIARSTLAQQKERYNVVRRAAALQISQADADLSTAKAAYNETIQRYGLVKRGARAELIRQAQARLDQAKATMAQDAQAYELLKAGARPEQVVQASAQVGQSEAEMRYRMQLIQNRFIKAPISGVIVSRNINPGELAIGDSQRLTSNTGQMTGTRSLFVIADTSSMEFLANVDQRYLNDVSIGQPATIQIESLPGQKFTGKVVRMNPVVSQPTVGVNNNALSPLTFPVWIKIMSPGKSLAPGQTGFVTLVGKRKGILVPAAAVVPMSQGQGAVYIEKNGVVYAKSVQYIKDGNGNVRIKSGLKPGSRVIVSDPTRLKTGMKVKPILTQANSTGMAPL